MNKGEKIGFAIVMIALCIIVFIMMRPLIVRDIDFLFDARSVR